MSTKKKSLDLYLSEVFKQFISIKDDDFKRSQEVFKSVFEQVKQKMGEQCNYFKKYSSQVMYAGSVYDGIKISKMDEFDMDIVIRLPINYGDGENGIMIEHEQPGFVKMKITKAFDHLDKQGEWDTCHKVTREWRDSDKYFLQNKFRQWMHKIVQRALNVMDGKVTVNGVVYLLKYKESGPAYTLNIRNDEGGEEFTLDVDLVPVIKFMYPRVPDGYRVVDGVQAKDWLVVPKPNKAINDNNLKNRCWRLSFQEQEREIIKGCLALKMTIRLVKKLRDSLKMKAIASYYIKTLFLWKVDTMKSDEKYWQNKVSVLFRVMVEELYTAIKNKNIPFFWNKDHNLIETLKPSLQKEYSDKLRDVLASIAANDADKLASFLLSKDEFKAFKNTEFYQKQAELPNVTPQMSVVDSPVQSESLSGQLKTLTSEMDALRAEYQRDEKMAKLEAKINDLADRVGLIEDRLSVLERNQRVGRVQTFTDSENSVSDIVGGAKAITLDDEPRELIDFLTPNA
ncbi:cyclic GMP-AMP synthase-like receptor [Anticarsia gemmatalis]|uniref:cyclic GMP-AMP synthase-like receptor n=1 Tax=Anticarsia gemmatalis TaxID=129554 RepID=UPI003F76D4E7